MAGFSQINPTQNAVPEGVAVSEFAWALPPARAAAPATRWWARGAARTPPVHRPSTDAFQQARGEMTEGGRRVGALRQHAVLARRAIIRPAAPQTTPSSLQHERLAELLSSHMTAATREATPCSQITPAPPDRAPKPSGGVGWRERASAARPSQSPAVALPTPVRKLAPTFDGITSAERPTSSRAGEGRPPAPKQGLGEVAPSTAYSSVSPSTAPAARAPTRTRAHARGAHKPPLASRMDADAFEAAEAAVSAALAASEEGEVKVEVGGRRSPWPAERAAGPAVAGPTRDGADESHTRKKALS